MGDTESVDRCVDRCWQLFCTNMTSCEACKREGQLRIYGIDDIVIVVAMLRNNTANPQLAPLGLAYFGYIFGGSLPKLLFSIIVKKQSAHFFYKTTWFQFQPAVSYFSVYFQPKVFRILFLIFVFEFPEHSGVKT